MIPEEQISTLRAYGYSKREAVFIATVALHSGYFIPRQYTGVHGGAVTDLGRKLTGLEHASVIQYGYKQKVYHIDHKAIYRVLGQEDNRHRRPQETFRMRGKIMGLDYVILHPGYRYLPTEEAKLEFFESERKLNRNVLPSRMYAGGEGRITLRYFIDKFPIRVHPETGHVTFVFVDCGQFTEYSFDTWLKQYTSLFSALGKCDVAYCTTDEEGMLPYAKKAFERFVSKLRTPDSIEEYFRLRREVESTGGVTLTIDELKDYALLQRTFANQDGVEERYHGYALAPVEEPRKAPEIRLSTYLLPYSYRWLGTAVNKERLRA
jgi:hypothetical protein